MLGYSRNAAIEDRNVPNGAEVILGIDHVPALEEQIVPGLREPERNDACKHKEEHCPIKGDAVFHSGEVYAGGIVASSGVNGCCGQQKEVPTG